MIVGYLHNECFDRAVGLFRELIGEVSGSVGSPDEGFVMMRVLKEERDDELPTTTAVVVSMNNSQSLSRRTKLMRGDNQLADGTYRPGSIDGGSFDGHDEESSLELNDEIVTDGHSSSMRNGDVKIVPRLIPIWLSSSNPDEFVVWTLLP